MRAVKDARAIFQSRITVSRETFKRRRLLDTQPA
jgi:hypothetical protein